MKTAVDSSALLAIFKDEPGASSFLNRIHEGLMQGEVVLCDIVVAEVGALFKDAEAFRAVLGKLGLQLDPIRFETACEAGRIFRAYRQAGGRREHLIPDFLVGAHAWRQGGGRLIGSDRGFYRSYFKQLELLA